MLYASQQHTRRRARHKAAAPTVADLEAYVSSPAYTPDGAQALAAQIPLLREKATGAPGELISPGIRRIHGNLCNVHGRYGPCDKALSGKKKPAKGREPRAPKKAPQTPAQRAQARDTQHQANVDSVAKQMADSDTGLSPSGVKALAAFAKGEQPDAARAKGLVEMGLAEPAGDGKNYRMTPTGHAVVSAMRAGDYQRAVDAVSRGTDASGRRTARQSAAQARTQAAADKRAASQAKRDARLAKQGKQPRAHAKKPTTTAQSIPHATAAPSRSSMPHAGARVSAPKPTPAPKMPAKAPAAAAPAKQIAPALQDAASKLSAGTATDEQVQTLVRNGLAKLNKDGEPVLTAAGLRATQKAASFAVFKDARGQYRWVSYSSNAYRDRDGEIVSTKALSDDCDYADTTGDYGPLRYWHTPGFDLGDCDFNAMHDRVLIESGTFRSQAIAEKVACASGDSEISIGFYHTPTEPDAHGVFHSIRRFERSIVPRGKASNRFTAFAVKELPMATLEERWGAAQKQFGFTDDELNEIKHGAEVKQKEADDQRTAFKATEPDELPDLVINGVTYKAFPSKAADAAPTAEAPVDDVVVEEDAEPPMEEDVGGLTLSQEDIDAIGGAVGGAITQAIAPLMGLLDIEKKMQGHVQAMMQPFAQEQATKDASDAEKAEQITALQTALKATQDQLAELTGDAPAAPYRASAAPDTVLGDLALLTAAKSQQPGAGPWDDMIEKLGITPRGALS